MEKKEGRLGFFYEIVSVLMLKLLIMLHFCQMFLLSFLKRMCQPPTM